ncbi:palmitoyltransferase [Tulasnella sp. JGI-2019a]|nr:palmitoyltransferase [Tulasnella sp. JGI-2019a]
MKIYSLAIISVPASGQAVSLTSASDLSSFSFYQRGSVAEFMTFFCKTVAERTKAGQRQSVQENNYTAHVYNRGGPDPLCSVVVTDQEYPVRPAFSLLSKILDDFDATVPSESRSDPSTISFPAINSYLSKYQDPKQADNIMKVQAELDETKIILVGLSCAVAQLVSDVLRIQHQTIESVLARGEKLDNLVDRSTALSQQSKMFYKTAKKQNSCCVVM